MIWLLVGVLAAAVAVVYLRRGFVQVTVDGESMAPTYRPGDRVLVRRVRFARLRVGDVVALRHPHDGTLLIKRVSDVRGETVWVLGDAGGEANNDSRRFGAVPASHIVGVAVRQTNIA